MCYFTPPSLHSPPPAMPWSTWPPFSLFVCQPKDRGQRPSSLPEVHFGSGLLSLLQRARCTSSNVVSLWCSFDLRIIFSDSGPRGWLVGKELLGNAFYLTTKQVTACVFQSVTCCVGVCMYFHLHHEPTTGGALPSRHCWGVGNHERERSQFFYWVPLRSGDHQNHPHNPVSQFQFHQYFHIYAEKLHRWNLTAAKQSAWRRTPAAWSRPTKEESSAIMLRWLTNLLKIKPVKVA